MAWIYDKKNKNEVKNYISLDKFPKIQGYDFSQPFSSKDFLKHYKNMGFQGSHLGIAIDILKEIKEKKVPIYIAFTGNMISSGNREIIKFLVKNNMVKGIVTTAAGIEEDVIKCIKPFHLGTFDVKGAYLLDNIIGRIGNIFLKAENYLYFERFLNELFPLLYKKQKSTGKIFSANEVVSEIAQHLPKNQYTKKNYKDSFIYWAHKNSIPVFCPGISDGTIGDILVFFKKNHSDFVIDVTSENSKLAQMLMDEAQAACIILGGGIAKHFLLNSAIFRDGFDYAIYLSTSSYHDGSDSGGNQEEAISWAKIKPQAKRIKVTADATLTFPLLIASMQDGN